MSKRPRKKYDPRLNNLQRAQLIAKRYIVSAVADIDKAVFVFDQNLNHVRLSSSTAAMINNVRHHWSIVVCVAGRYKNGKVWVRYEQANSSMQATAHEISPLVTDLVDGFFEQQDKRQRLCRWWVAVPTLDHNFSAEDIITPAIRANVFRAFITEYENETTKLPVNCPIEKGDRLTNEEFKEWWDKSVSSRSQLQQLWIEE